MNRDYLIRYGVMGDVGRFRAGPALVCRRGDRAVVRSRRGLELGEVLCPTGPAEEAHGDLLRLATPEDEQTAHRRQRQCDDFLAEARGRAAVQALPVELLDVELLLDDQAWLHYVRWDTFDPRDLVSGLSRDFDLTIRLLDLTRADAAHEEHGCGSCGSGGCGSGGCGSGGCGSGCGSGGCGTITEDLRAYFAELREQMHRHDRTPLL
jgi:cell fate regulator YaaT (PSP1 superfamily)